MNDNLEKIIEKLETIKKQLNESDIKYSKIKNLNFDQIFENSEKSKEIKIKTKALSKNVKKNDELIKLSNQMTKKYEQSIVIYNSRKKELEDIKLKLYQIYNNLKNSEPLV